MAFTVPNEADATFADQAKFDSRDLGSILGLGHSRYGVLSGCVVAAQGSPNMTVAVASGTVLVGNKVALVGAGNATIGAADATNPRFDLITVSRTDPSNAGTVTVVAGTAAANPTFPDPAGKTVLAAIYVPVGTSSIDSTRIVDKRVAVVLSRPGLIDVSDYGAIPDDYYTDGVANGTTTFTSATANFTSADIGKNILICHAGDSSAQDRHTTIAAVGSSTSVTLTNGAGRSQTSCRFYISRGGDSTTSIQNAINAAATAGGGIVFLSGVGYLHTGLTIKSRVWLRGTGMKATCLHLSGGLSAPCIKNDDTLNNSGVATRISDMWIDGNRDRSVDTTSTIATTGYVAGASTLTLASTANFETSGYVKINAIYLFYTGKTGSQLTGVSGNRMNTVDANQAIGQTVTQYTNQGIRLARYPLSSGGSIEEEYDPHHKVHDVLIKNVRGAGIVTQGQSEIRMDSVWVNYADQMGFWTTYDSWISNCTADTVGRMGFYMNNSQMMFSNCKAWFSGGNVNADGAGFWVESDSQPATGCIVFSSCLTQDNKGPGWFLKNADRIILASCGSDSNSVSSTGTYPGIALVGANYCIIDINCVERGANGSNQQQNGLSIDIASTNNHIRLIHGASNSATVGTPLSSASDPSGGGNTIIINGMDALGVQTAQNNVQYVLKNGSFMASRSYALGTSGALKLASGSRFRIL